MEEELNLYELALEYEENNYYVIPLSGKRPMVEKWSDWRNLDVEKNKSFYLNKSCTGIGLLCGEKSNVIALDIDILSKEKQEEIKKMLPPIYSGRIGNKDKLPTIFFQYNGEENRKYNNVSIEILSNGSQVVLPPSVHPDFNYTYEWVGQQLINISSYDLPVIPPSLVDFIHEENEKRKKDSTYEIVHADGRCNHGSHNKLSSMAVAMCIEGESFEFILKKLIESDKKINPLIPYFLCPSRKWRTMDIEKNARSFLGEVFFRNAHRHSTVTFKKDRWDKFIENGFTKQINEEEYVRELVLLFKFFEEKHRAYYIPDQKGFMIYNSVYYEFVDQNYAKNFCQRYYLNPICTKMRERNEFSDLCKYESRNLSLESFLKMGNDRIINFNNGAFDLKNKNIIDHSHTHHLSKIIPYSIIPDGGTKTFDQLLNAIFLERKNMVKIIYQFIGYILSGDSYFKHNKVLILDGTGANGKSTLIQCITMLVGSANYNSISMKEITENRFAASGLVGKLVNFCAEEDKQAFANSGPLKKLTGNDPITTSFKNKDAFSFVNKAKFVISYNEMPRLADHSEGMLRRLLILPCEQNFNSNPDKKIPDVINKVKKEIGAIAYKSLLAYLEMDEFEHCDESLEKIESLVNFSDSIYDFVENCITYQEGSRIKSRDIWEAFVEFEGRKTFYKPRSFYLKLKTVLDKKYPQVKHVAFKECGRLFKGYSNIIVEANL